MSKSPLSSSASTWSASWLASLPSSARRKILAQLNPSELELIRSDGPFWAHPAQLPPEGHWAAWLFMGGRGAGKSWAGASWLKGRAVPGAQLALIGPTLHDVREVMVEGPSGIRVLSHRQERPRYEVSRRRLVWSSGAVAYAFSAEDPDSLRGPQFDAAWCDEFCAWPRGGETLALLRMGLRRGSDPRLMLTTTPRPTPDLRRLMDEPGVVVTRAATRENAANLAPRFLAQLSSVYGGTRLAAQELEGQVVEASERALWRAGDLERARGARPPSFDRVVVAVDPPASQDGDACGIVAAGRRGEMAFVLADRSLAGLSPPGWAARVVETARLESADAIVAEANQGGEMVRALLVSAQCTLPVKLVHARLGKHARAEPVAALYQQGRVVHCGAFPALEEELMAFGPERSGPSPDRADALVWALTALMLDGRGGRPRLSVL